ncbi:hypothetical protein [Streptomyces sp. DSM 41534]
MATPTSRITGHDDNQLNTHDFAAGIADAYDEDRAGLTLAELTVRLAWLIDEHPNLSYVLGYASVVQRLAIEADITAEVDAELAYTHVEPNPEATR